MSRHVFGIRHHGPGCSRSLVAALEALAPDVVLVEGPPDAEAVLPFVASADLQPPVAILIYPVDDPQRGVFYPFAEFSPEWQALHYAQHKGIPARFMDLPLRHRLPLEQARIDELLQELAAKAETGSQPVPENAPDATDDSPDLIDSAQPADAIQPIDSTEPGLYDDPLGMLATAAGYQDHELWWEHQIEQRQDPTGLFEGILEAMTTLRLACAERPNRVPYPYEAEREASMRQIIRQAEREKFERIAIVCGAWHAPALVELGPATHDATLLRDLPKEKVAATWIPWTYSRLSYRSGYGAGVRSPGWYEHLWQEPRGAPTRWIATAARLLRDEDLDASSASVIEAVRLSTTLAALRDLPLAGLAELNDAMLAVLCSGNETPLALVRERLEIGNRLGRVPDDTPSVPLQKDVEQQQKSLRLKPSTEIKSLDLDLRGETDLARSRLLHRMRLLGIPWGEPQEARGKAGSFHEIWKLQWQVEFVVQIIEAAVWGNTVERAATANAASHAEKATDLPALTDLLERTLLADLPAAVQQVLDRLQQLAAVSADVRHMAAALPPLARVARYSDVRKTDATRLLPVIASFFERIVVGLGAACTALDDAAAEEMAQALEHVQQSLDLLDRADYRDEWHAALALLADNDAVHGLLRGLACRQLLEAGKLDDDALHRRARLELSPVAPPAAATAWLQGVLRGSGLLLMHRESLWQSLDAWLVELSQETFTEMLPMVRRAFANFTSPERRAMGEKVKLLTPGGASSRDKPKRTARAATDINHARARLVLPVLAQLLGVNPPTND